MGKWIFAVLLIGAAPMWAFQKLDMHYQRSFGNAEAPIKVVEYFSLTCPHCIRFFNQDFDTIKSKYLDSKQVVWTFHPDPADILTLQFMVCLDRLEESKRNMFLYVVMKMFEEDMVKASKHPKKYVLTMKKVMEHLEQPVPELEELSFLEKTEAFQRAYAFLKQKDVPRMSPTLEINGIIQDECPTLEFLDKKILALTKNTEELRKGEM